MDNITFCEDYCQFRNINDIVSIVTGRLDVFSDSVSGSCGKPVRHNVCPGVGALTNNGNLRNITVLSVESKIQN